MSAGYGGAAMERRMDPYDGKTQTLQEMVKKYQGTWVAYRWNPNQHHKKY